MVGILFGFLFLFLQETTKKKRSRIRLVSDSDLGVCFWLKLNDFGVVCEDHWKANLFIHFLD